MFRRCTVSCFLHLQEPGNKDTSKCKAAKNNLAVILRATACCAALTKRMKNFMKERFTKDDQQCLKIEKPYQALEVSKLNRVGAQKPKGKWHVCS